MSQQLIVGSDLAIVYSAQYLDYIVSQVNSPIYNIYHPNCVDKCKKGKSSSANFVSRVLLSNEMIVNPHVQIRILLDEMRLCGWIRDNKFTIEDLIPGDVIVWEQNSFGHQHIGFVVTDSLAVSFYGKKGYPILHELEFEDLWRGRKRNIIGRYTLAK